MASPSIHRDVALLAARLAHAHGFERVFGARSGPWAEAALAYPDVDFAEATPLPSAADLRRSVIVTGAPGIGGDAGRTIDELRVALDAAPLVIVIGPGSPDGLEAQLTEAAVPATLIGLAPGGGALAIVDRAVPPPSPAPTGFRVLAVMTAYNEADVIGPTIEALIDAGVEVHLIDNWSTDETHAIASRYLGRGLAGLERFPAAPSGSYEWAALLGRVERVAAASPADWYVHHDADERRTGPWPARPLRDAIWAVQQSGFNAIDHTVLTFQPLDEGFVPGADLERSFRHFEFDVTPGIRPQVKAWRNLGRRVDLAGSGGHEAVFDGRRIFPYNFLLKHYPIRSQAHGERKVLHERQARWSPAERARGWHVHYEAIEPGHAFTRAAGELIEFRDGETERRHLVPMVSGIGLFPSGVPGWATRGRGRAMAFRLARGLLGGSRSGAARSAVARLPLLGRPARWAWRRLMGAG
jgi:hypothetical protein